MKELIQTNQLNPVDAIILKKRFLGMVDHYVLFMGFRNSKPVLIANYRDGVREVPYSDIKKYAEKLEPVRIEKFEGDEWQRQHAINRAWSRLGEKAYNYIANNCEHFKNWVHWGDNYSEQVNRAGNAAITGGAIVAVGGLAAKNPKAALIGTATIILGLIAKKLA